MAMAVPFVIFFAGHTLTCLIGSVFRIYSMKPRWELNWADRLQIPLSEPFPGLATYLAFDPELGGYAE